MKCTSTFILSISIYDLGAFFRIKFYFWIFNCKVKVIILLHACKSFGGGRGVPLSFNLGEGAVPSNYILREGAVRLQLLFEGVSVSSITIYRGGERTTQVQ